ncbi:1736_t:CDS:2 [Cetraspora pellucida]|uniref:1736_t:CDS:1 n=1 Tax=Cetraspora pellucida TaxID=1433469 RepID=A0A9N9D0D9_9GLOM|nr:1736_t:CDS:2 [Cetraspora pellucida]
MNLAAEEFGLEVGKFFLKSLYKNTTITSLCFYGNIIDRDVSNEIYNLLLNR